MKDYLYRRLPSEGVPITILIQPEYIPDELPGGGIDCSGGEGLEHGAGRRTIRELGRTNVGTSKGSSMVEGSRQTIAVETSKFDKNGVKIGVTTSGSDMDNNGATDKRRGVVHMDRYIRSYLEFICLHHEQPSTFLHHPARLPEWVKTGERYWDINLGG